MNQNARPQYYEGEYLSADDLQAIVRYARVAQARHTLGAHMWGIAVGLDLVERSLEGDDVEMVLTPGVAWDGYARALVAPAPQRLPLDLFANFQSDTLSEGIPIEVWIAYHESPASPPGVGFSCPDDQLYGSVVESFRVELRRNLPPDSHLVSIANRSLDALDALKTFDAGKASLYDESVPQQLFPENGDKPPWSIFVGIVRWKKDTGLPGKLIKRSDDDLNLARSKRRYVGLVAETIAAPGGVLRLRDRANDPNDSNLNFKPPVVAAPAGTPIVNDLVWCEGHLRVVGDARLQPSASDKDDGKLDFRVAKGGDADIAIYLRRTSTPGVPAKTTLDAFVAPPAAVGPANAKTRFTVSTKDNSGNPKECLTVVTDGHVGINAADPDAALHVHTDDGGSSNIRLFSSSAEFEYDGGSDKVFIFKDTGGKTMFAGGSIGVGVVPLSKLHVHSDSPTQGDIQLFSANGDFEYDGGSDKLFVFKDAGGKTAFLGGSIGVGVVPTSKLHVHSDSPAQGDVQLFSTNGDFEYDGGSDKLFVFKDTGGKTAFMGGSVGIGTDSPEQRLHVSGDRIRLTSNGKRIDLRTDGTAVDLQSETDNLYIRSTGPGGKNNVIVNALTGDGNVGIGTESPTAKLHIVGNMQLNGDQFVEFGGIWTTSDRRQKETVRSIERPLERLLALQGIDFQWRDPKKHQATKQERQLGFVAQDVESVFPEWVKETPSGTKAVNVSGLNALVVEAMREVVERCNRLEAEVAKLRARLGMQAKPSNSPTAKRPRVRGSRRKSPPANP